eukprot:TRINITY_DN95782_c0_g1_i1.p1 TRINITY_DN95782_c0_g1~~TRINITY_DN95782_c0_g1_i1.p1  ORF type:complete len:294 (-),score=30.58 TRINITY_DN95782_c0_g1_i1:28-909(-)
MNSEHVQSLLENTGHVRQVHSLLGTGSFSYVFRCTLQDYPEQVAVKALRSKELLPGRGREAHFNQSLRHINLVNLIQSVETDELDYFVLELCRGGNLQDVLHNTPDRPWDRVPLPERARAGRDVAVALDFLHQMDILHRDVKSGNTFLLLPLAEAWINDTFTLPTVKLGDLGFARPMSDYDNLTQGVGTMRYMAPEVINSGDYGTKADVFSLGILIHECLSGGVPFGSRNEASMCLAILEGTRPEEELIPLADDAWNEQRERLIGVLKACWVESADDRLTAGEVAEQLDSVLG